MTYSWEQSDAKINEIIDSLRAELAALQTIHGLTDTEMRLIMTKLMSML